MSKKSVIKTAKSKNKLDLSWCKNTFKVKKINSFIDTFIKSELVSVVDVLELYDYWKNSSDTIVFEVDTEVLKEKGLLWDFIFHPSRYFDEFSCHELTNTKAIVRLWFNTKGW